MLIEYDPAKREETLRERGLDFEDAPKVFAEVHVEMEDDRADYGEPAGSCSASWAGQSFPSSGPSEAKRAASSR